MTYDLRIVGAFSGYHGEAIFQLSNGQVWQQRRYAYRYKYIYRPVVRLERGARGETVLVVEGMDDEGVEVVRVNVIEDGPIVSDFSGFSGDSVFEFQGGRVWKQAEYKYAYHYAYRPNGLVVDGPSGTVLHVDGMSESVRVRQVK